MNKSEAIGGSMSLFGFVTNRQLLTSIKEVKSIMADLNASVEALRAAVTGVSERVAGLVGPLRDALAAAQESLEAERAAAVDLATAEDVEDAEQNAALANAQADVDAKLAEAEAAVGRIDTVVADLNEIAAQAEPVPADEEPV